VPASPMLAGEDHLKPKVAENSVRKLG